jgi:hypothetical protein
MVQKHCLPRLQASGLHHVKLREVIVCMMLFGGEWMSATARRDWPWHNCLLQVARSWRCICIDKATTDTLSSPAEDRNSSQAADMTDTHSRLGLQTSLQSHERCFKRRNSRSCEIPQLRLTGILFTLPNASARFATSTFAKARLKTVRISTPSADVHLVQQQRLLFIPSAASPR